MTAATPTAAPEPPPASAGHDPSMEGGRRHKHARLRQSSYETAPMSGVDAGCGEAAAGRADAGPISCEMPAGGT